MQRAWKSFGHALDGLSHAIASECNLQRFLVCYSIVLLLAGRLNLTAAEWASLILAGGLFCCIELFNTALERFVDAFDEHRKSTVGDSFHLGLKATKDIASAASLVSLLVVIMTVAIILGPKVWKSG